MSDDQPEQLRARTFHRRSLQRSRFIECDLGAVVVRGSDVAGMEIDSPWLLEGGARLLVNGVDVVPLVDAELDRRFPGRELRAGTEPTGLVAAWAALEQAWAATLARAVAMPPGTLDASVDGEWSFAQTLRHLVMATDTWLGRAVLQLDQPFHPIGLPDDSAAGVDDGAGGAAARPSFAEVLEARTGRQAMVRDFLGGATAEQLALPRNNPHAPEHQESVLSCLRTILEEEWEHHRYAVRDLGALEASGPAASQHLAHGQAHPSPDRP